MDQDTEDPGVSNPIEEENAMPVKLPGPIPTNDNNTPTVDTTSDVVTINNESDTEEDESENKENPRRRRVLVPSQLTITRGTARMGSVLKTWTRPTPAAKI